LLHVLPDFPLSLRIPEQVGRMIGGNDLDSSKVIASSAKCCDLGIGFEKGLGSKFSERTDDFRLDRPDLLKEKRMAALDLIGLRIPILWRAAFDDIRDVNVLSSKINGLEDLGQ